MNKFVIQSGATELRRNPLTGQKERVKISHTLDLSPWDEHRNIRWHADYYPAAKRIASGCLVFPQP